MKIIFFSPNFYPLVGGLELVQQHWAVGLAEAGHEVSVITLTKSDEPNPFPFAVYRSIGQLRTWQLMRQADVVIQMNVSLKGILPCLFSFKPFIISHHSTNFNLAGQYTRWGRLKQFIANTLATKNIACSNFVAGFIKNTVVVNNPYDSKIFRRKNKAVRSNDLVFVGRLVSDKGCAVVLQALILLKKMTLDGISLTVVGDGPEFYSLLKLAEEEGIKNQTNFVGKKKGVELADILNNSKVVVVPSIWEEPFGIVALEGLACGCEVIVSKAGGLPEAVGTFGYIVEKNNPQALAEMIKSVLTKIDRGILPESKLNAFLHEFTVSSSVSQLIKSITA